MTRCVNEVQLIFFAVLGLVIELDGVRLDRDSTLPFKIHVVKKLFGHIANSDRLRKLKQTVCKSGFAVVNVSDYGKISYMVFFYSQNITSVIQIMLRT